MATWTKIEVQDLVANQRIGLEGSQCVEMELIDIE